MRDQLWTVEDMSDRRPYRVLFSPPPTRPAARKRSGIIVARDAETAHHEAEGIARAGGTAEVQYVAENGDRHTVARYEPAEEADCR